MYQPIIPVPRKQLAAIRVLSIALPLLWIGLFVSGALVLLGSVLSVVGLVLLGIYS